MSDDRAVFGLELLDKMSGPAEKIVGGLEGATGALEKLQGSSGRASEGMSRVGKAVEYMTFALRGIQIAHGAIELTKALGGLGNVKKGIVRAGQALRQFGQWAMLGLKRVAPFAAGGAGLYGLGKIAAGVALPAMGATTAAIGAVGVAAAGATLAVGYLGFKLAGLAVDGIKATASFAVFGQNSRMAFNALAKYGASGAKIFNHVRDLADEFGMDVRSTSDNYRDLLSTGFNPKQADQITKMGADMRFLGKSAEQVKLAVIGISQIKATGNLQGDELNQVANAIGLDKSAVFDQIAAKLGKTREEVLKLKDAGKLAAGPAIEGILGAVMKQAGEKELGERGKQWANSAIEGFVGRIQAKGQNLMIDLGDRLAPTLQRLAGAAFAWVDNFIQSGRAEKLIGRIGDTFDAVGDVMMKVSPLVGRFMDGFGAEATKAFDGLSRAVTYLGGADGKMAGDAFEKMGRGIAQIVIYGGAAIAALVGMVGAVGVFTDQTLRTFIGIPVKFAEIGINMALGLAKGIRDGVVYVLGAVEEMAGAAVNRLRGFLDVRSPSRVFGEVGTYSALGFAMGISANAGAAEDASRDMALASVAASSAEMRSLAPVGASPNFGALDTGRLGRGGGSVRFGDIIVHADNSDPNEVADKTRLAVRREIDDYFRQFDSEA